MKLRIIVVLLLFLFCGAGSHPVHVSITEIAFDENEKELEVVLRVFIDDLETAVRDSKKQSELNLLTPELPATTRSLIWEYLEPRLNISLDGKAQKLKYLGHEIESEAIVLYVQVQPVKKWKSIEVENSIITELYDDQSNLVHVTVREQTKSLRLMRDNPLGKVTFDIK